MDRSWVTIDDRLSAPYITGLNNFLDTTYDNPTIKDHILCPCKRCCNRYHHQRSVVYQHLIVHGMERRYRTAPWIHHGEALYENGNIEPSTGDQAEGNGMNALLNDFFGNLSDSEDEPSNPHPSHTEGRTPDADRFYKLVDEANEELYPGCTGYKKLEFIVTLYQLKVDGGWSDKSFSRLLTAVKKSFPEGETLPNSFYQTKKLIGELGLSYEMIHACKNDCMLYWKDTATATSCMKCGTSRWKDPDKKVLAKVFRYFPLTLRLQRLYMSRHTAEHMRWHDTNRTKDGAMRHPADSAAWRSLDERHPDFGIQSRNVRLGLASDGFNPFGNMSTAYSTWPVVIAIYNLPPWMCMKQPYLLLSSLIPGPKGPGNDIDVYLQPLIHELKELWEIGASTYDVSLNQTFTMRAALLWTINDFPAYANLSGWSTKGRYACPNCNYKTCSKWLVNGKKFCYMGHRRFLGASHHYRRQKKAFNNFQEFDPSPPTLSGTDCLKQLEGMTFTLGKRKRSTTSTNQGPWKKRSIFFYLPYWEHHLLRHNIDVMHVEKNVCDAIVGTLLDIKGKTKDGPKARADLKRLKMRPHLHLAVLRGRKVLPPAIYTLNKAKKKIFCKVLSSVKVPDGYASNLSRCVNLTTTSIAGWKSHDCHVVMQQLLPLAMRQVLPKVVMNALNEICAFFKAVCSKNATPIVFQELSSKITLALCEMEKIFPPAFFDVMVHLPVHLAYEASIAGPVHYRWMYPIERYLQTLKGYVRNKSRPEGCIAEGYLVEECLSFCSMYLDGVDSKRNRSGRNTDHGGRFFINGLPIFVASGKHIGKVERVELADKDWSRARHYVLFNCDQVKPFIDEHFQVLRRMHPRKTTRELEHMQKEHFAFWFNDKVIAMYAADSESVSEDMRFLALGPQKLVRRSKKYVVNGFRFRTKAVDMGPQQNNGVFVTAQTSSYSSRRDQNPTMGNVDYYGVLNDVIELSYYGDKKVVLFECDWVDSLVTSRCVKKDEFGFTLVNLSRTLPKDDNFILASQALQVFYVQDPVDIDWHVAIKTSPRDYFDMNEIIL